MRSHDGLGAAWDACFSFSFDQGVGCIWLPVAARWVDIWKETINFGANFYSRARGTEISGANSCGRAEAPSNKKIDVTF